MRRLFAALGLSAMGLSVLAGCSGGTGATPLFPEVFQAARGAIAQGAAKRAQSKRPPLTRAALGTVEGAFIEVTLERSGQLAYLFRSAVLQDANPGAVVQWRTEDNVTVTMRAGMVIATRGLGGDLVSAHVPAATGTLGPARSGERALFVRTGDLAEHRISLACDLGDLGAETIEIVERAHATRHLRETCEAEGGGRVENEYWIDSRAGIVWQSVQWAGPHVGYLRIRRLTQ